MFFMLGLDQLILSFLVIPFLQPMPFGPFCLITVVKDIWKNINVKLNC